MILHKIDLKQEYNAEKILELARNGELVSVNELEDLGFKMLRISTPKGLGTTGVQFEDGSIAVFDPTIANSSKDWWRPYRNERTWPLSPF